METLRKNPKQMLAVTDTVPEMKNIFDGLISKLDMAKERISELEDMFIKTSVLKFNRNFLFSYSRTETQRESIFKKNRIFK